MTAGQRLARLASSAVAVSPALWPLFRPLIRREFDRLAPVWDLRRSAGRLESYGAALDRVPGSPRRALDVGTGTGDGAFEIARRWPETEVVGVDVAEGMLAHARAKAPYELASRVRFVAGDAARLPFPDASFDLVALGNMIPFVHELARVLEPGGMLVVSFSSGPATPIYVPLPRLRRLLERHGLEHVSDLVAGPGEALLARRAG